MGQLPPAMMTRQRADFPFKAVNPNIMKRLSFIALCWHGVPPLPHKYFAPPACPSHFLAVITASIMSFLSFYIESLMVIIWNDNPSNVRTLLSLFLFQYNSIHSKQTTNLVSPSLSQVFCVKTWESDKICTVWRSVFNKIFATVGIGFVLS